MPTLRSERARACYDLAFAEVISYNKANLERMEQNESRQQDRQQAVSRTVGRTKRREEELYPWKYKEYLIAILAVLW